MTKKFDDWEVLPPDTMDALGAQLDASLKHLLKSEVEEMFIDSSPVLYSVANKHLLEWMMVVVEKAEGFQIFDRGNGLVLSLDLVPDDYDEDFAISMPFEQIARKSAEWEEFMNNPGGRKSIADELRRIADAIDAPSATAPLAN